MRIMHKYCLIYTGNLYLSRVVIARTPGELKLGESSAWLLERPGRMSNYSSNLERESKYMEKVLSRASRGLISGALLTLAAILIYSTGCAGPSAPAPEVKANEKPSSQTSPSASSPGRAFANPDLLVESDWLAQRVSDSSIRVVDARKAEDYRAGHIPGAVNVTIDSAFLPGASQGIVGSPEQIAKLFGDRGVSNDSRVIVYDAGKSYNAPYLLWVLEYYGHKQVSVLNGGFSKWQKETRPVSTADPAVNPATLAPKADPSKRATLADVKSALGNAKYAIVDSRSPEEFRGDQVNAKRGGHIPGAVNIDWVTLFNPDGTFKSAADLAKLHEEKGVTKDKLVIANCQVGFRSAAGYLALRLLGNSAANYDASWNEWGNDASLPVEK